MKPHTPLNQLGPLLEQLLEEPDRHRRERLLVHGIHEAGLAGTVALHAEGRPWVRLLCCGPAQDLPGPSLVASVAAGEIGPELPPDRLVVVSGDPPGRRALVLAGGLGDEQRSDLVEALLVFLSCLDSIDAPLSDPGLADRILPPFQRRDDRQRSATADVAHDLRALLSSIRCRQEEIDMAPETLDGTEKQRLSEVVDRECQLAGDLLLDAFATGEVDSDGEVCTPPARAGSNRWLRLFEEIAAAHAPRLREAGCPLTLSAIDSGPCQLDLCEETFRSIVSSMLELVEPPRAHADDASRGIDLSLRPRRRAGRPGLQLCVESRPRGSAGSLSTRRMHEWAQQAGGDVRSDEAGRIEVWLPCA